MTTVLLQTFAHEGHDHHDAASINLVVYMVGLGVLVLICLVAILAHRKPRKHKTKTKR